MRRGDAFQSKFLKTDDLQDREHELTIEQVRIETIEGQGDDADEEKAVVFFEGKKKGMVLNATNWDTLEEAYGEESDDWRGRPVILFPSTTKYRGKKVACMRFRVPVRKPADDPPPPDDRHAPPPPDDDVPF